MTFYNIIYPIVFVPLYFYAFFSLVSAVRDDKPSQNWLVSALLFAMFFHVVAIRFLYHEWGMWHPFVSESNLLSIIITFSFISSLNTILKNNYASFIIIPTLTVMVALCKISTGYILLCTLIYIAVRHFSVKLFISVVLSVLSFYLAFKYTTGPYAKDISLNGIISAVHSNLNLSSLLRWYAVFVLFIIILALSGSINKYKYEIEILFIASFSAIIPCILFNLNVVDSSYFKSLPFWLSAALLCSQTNWTSGKYQYILFVKYLIVVLLLFPLAYYFINSTTAFVSSITNRPAYIDANVPSNGFVKIINDLYKIDKIDKNDKLHARIYLDKKCLFWSDSNIDKDYDQFKRPLYVPALTGIAMISGTENINDITYNKYGYASYNLHSRTFPKLVLFFTNMMKDDVNIIIENSTPVNLEILRYPFSRLLKPGQSNL
jgi:hypothetical protein